MAELAASQHGVVALRQLEALGMAAATVRSWVAEGWLIRLHQGVFAVGHASLRPEGRYLAAVLACGPRAALSYRSAAALLGLRASAAARLDVTAPIRTGRCRPGIRVHRGDRLAADEVHEHLGVPCTTVARTLLDLAVVLDRRGIEAAVETAERNEVFDLRSTIVLLGRHRGRRGVARLRLVLAQFDAEVTNVRSELEARLFHLCVDHGLPRPLVNRRLSVGGRELEVDFHWPRSMLVVETDGARVHGTTGARLRDPERDRLLTDAGWQIRRADWHAVVVNPEPLVLELRRRTAADRPTG